jgi:hypothetical protein
VVFELPVLDVGTGLPGSQLYRRMTDVSTFHRFCGGLCVCGEFRGRRFLEATT